MSLSLDSVSSSSRFVIRPLLATSSKSRINYQPSCKDNSCWYDYELVNGPCSNDIGNVADTRGRHPPYIITQLHAASFLAASFRDARACVRARYDRANVVDFVQLNGAHGTPMIARTTAVN